MDLAHLAAAQAQLGRAVEEVDAVLGHHRADLIGVWEQHLERYPIVTPNLLHQV
jgi:hypothetical protein